MTRAAHTTPGRHAEDPRPAGAVRGPATADRSEGVQSMTPRSRARHLLASPLLLLLVAIGPPALAATAHPGPSDREPGPTSPQGGSLATNPGSAGPAPALAAPGA